MRPRWKSLLVAILASPLVIILACTEAGPGAQSLGDTELARGTEGLYRAPAIPNVVDGVVWEAGNWEPHLAAGDEGVSWGNHRAVVAVEETAGGGEASTGGAGAVAGSVEAATLAANAVQVTIPWRRRDENPESKGIIVVDATSGEVVPNAIATHIDNSSGDIVFQPNPGSSLYHVYYLPWQSSGGYYPTITYPTPNELREAARGSSPSSTGRADSPSRAQQGGQTGFSWAGLAPDPDPSWEESIRATGPNDFPSARVTHIQSVDEFHSFFPMEVIATPNEEAAFWASVTMASSSTAAGPPAAGTPTAGPPAADTPSAGTPSEGTETNQKWAVVPEHRDFPIRMRHFLPHHWVARSGASLTGTNNGVSAETFDTFFSQVLKGEAFTFQLAVLPGTEPLDDIQVTFQDFPDSWMDALNCYNCGGINEKGISFSKDIHVPAGTVQPLWIGARIPESQSTGPVEGTVTVTSSSRGTRTVRVSLDVQDGQAPHGGADEPDLQTRLAWLNSTVGTDPDFIIAPFEPVIVEGATADGRPALSILGRRVELGATGLPHQIFSYFTPELTHFAEEPEPILAQPLALRVVTPGGFVEEFRSSPFEINQEAAGSAHWTVESTSDYLDMTVEGILEYDGMLDLRITLVALSDAPLDDVALPISLVPDAAEYMLGLGQKGGKRPAAMDWKWAVENHQEGVWLGGVHKGLQYVLRDANYIRPLNTNFYQNQPLNMPPSWFNDGLGGIQIFEEPETEVSEGGSGQATVTAYNYSGPRIVADGDTLNFNVRFLITPFKPIDTENHFNTRFVHQYVPVDSVQEWGGTVVNIHHANEINPYINYPFFSLDQQAAYIDEAHEKGIKVKLYNTIRELTYKAYELFAMRSLGDEILNDGEGGGHSWMQEHMEGDYHSAWHASRTDDAAMLNKGTSRWTNYYIEGIAWLAANQHIDGLYLDDIAFSRETVKRMVTVLDQNRPEVVIDLHSANQFNVRDGFTNSAMLYMEHFPFISRLWFGEYFEYDLDEDYWMTEVSGLPFGLMGEMLQDGGHPYRGLLYGMTGRKYGGNDPRPVWAMMNDFGIAESRMLGYWLEDTPVTTDHPRILATTYVGANAALIALASWSDNDEVVDLTVDWDALGWGEGSGPEVVGEGSELEAAAEGNASAMVRAYAPAVEGLQEEAELDLSAITVPAGQGLFLVVRNDPSAG